MGASDNIAAGIFGAATAVQDVLGKYFDYKLGRRARKEDIDDMIELYKAKLPLQQEAARETAQMTADIGLEAYKTKLPIQQEAARKTAQMTADIDVESERALIKPKEESRIRIEKAKPRTTFVQMPDGTFVPVEGKVSRAPKPPVDPHVVQKAREEYADAKSFAAENVPEIDRILPLNEKSLGGLVGGLRQKAMSMADLEDEKFRNTADFINSARAMVAKVLKATFGGQLSEGEREYLNTVYGAMPSYSVAERRIAMTNVRNMLTSKVKEKQIKLTELTGKKDTVKDPAKDGSTQMPGDISPGQRKPLSSFSTR